MTICAQSSPSVAVTLSYPNSTTGLELEGKPIEVDTTIDVIFRFASKSQAQLWRSYIEADERERRYRELSAFDQTFFDHFFFAEPEVGNVRGAKTKNVLQRAAHFTATEVHTNAIEKIE